MLIPFNPRALDRLARACKDTNTAPVFLPRHTGTYGLPRVRDTLQPVLDEGVTYLEQLNDEVFEQVRSSLSGHWKFMLDGQQLSPDELRRKVALYLIADELRRRRLNMEEVLPARPASSRVLTALPALEGCLDDKGLLYLDERFVVMPQGIQYQGYVLQYHQLMRRGYASNVNLDFTTLFSRLVSEHQENQYRVAIDHDRLMTVDEFERFMELSTWRGPAFDSAKLDDPHHIGTTVLERELPLEVESYALQRTEFCWGHKDGVKSLEIEEISRPEAVFGGAWHFNRYVHSERDTRAKRFRHLDGAVKAYHLGEYATRLSSRMPAEHKASRKSKLWRVDGDIAGDDWTALIGMFFRYNEMVVRYLDPQGYDALRNLRAL